MSGRTMAITRAVIAATLSLGAVQAAAAQQVDPKKRPATPQPGCLTNGCHAEVTSFPVLHGPVAASSCDACHVAADPAKHTFSLTRPGTELCLFCHEQPAGSILHKPVTDGQCSQCHNPHGGATRSFLAAPTERELCLKCHADVGGGKKHMHGPVGSGACSACHAPHASNHAKLLLRPSRQMCIECHVSSQQRLETSAFIHGPVATDCMLCHEAHSGDDRMLLKMPAQTLCLSCHEDIKSTVEHAKTQHGAVVEGRQCMNCHDPHAANHPMILKKSPTSLCMECHNKAIDTPGGKIADMSAILATGKSLHGPVAQENCSACHQIHGGDLFRLLTHEYPPHFYAPFKEESYALCFNCHERSLVLEAKTTALTGFRNGDINLHFLHVNKDTKGRTCRACHETHASDHAKHIRDTVPFGKWEMPIKFAKTETGGSCAPGCHSAFAYDRVKAVVYERKPGGTPAIWPMTTEPTTQPAGGRR